MDQSKLSTMETILTKVLQNVLWALSNMYAEPIISTEALT